jgi:hypothetical protein
MATTTKGRSQDRKLVASGQDHEVQHEAKKAGVSKSEVKAAVKTASNSRRNAEKALDSKQ